MTKYSETEFQLMLHIDEKRNVPSIIYMLTKYGNGETILITRGRLGRDRMEVGFTTTFVINAYHH
jgi:hypothetical protein